MISDDTIRARAVWRLHRQGAYLPNNGERVDDVAAYAGEPRDIAHAERVVLTDTRTDEIRGVSSLMCLCVDVAPGEPFGRNLAALDESLNERVVHIHAVHRRVSRTPGFLNRADFE